MTNIPTWQEIPYPDYSIRDISAPSSNLLEIDIEEQLNQLLYALKGKKLPNILPYHFLRPLFEIDPSSVWASPLEVKNETFSSAETIEEMFQDEIIEYDIFVRVPPKQRYKIKLNIKNIRKGMPTKVE